MARPTSSHPTELELEILKIIWRDGPLSVRQVRDALKAERPLAHTSVMTIMNIMTRKKYLRRQKSEAGGSGATAYIYSARVGEKTTLGKMLRDLVDRVFGGSTSAVMQNLLTNDLDAKELAELRDLIERKSKDL
jgi:BlaI family penicillinase repressor